MPAPIVFSPEQSGIRAPSFTLQPPGSAGSGMVGEVQGGGFAASLRKALGALVQPQQDAAQAVQQFADGKDGELHKTMLTMERADITMKFFVSLRNKALEAYREVMHMGS